MADITPIEAGQILAAQCDLATREVAVEFSRRVIDRTPVKTGQARGGWRGSLHTGVAEGGTILDPSGTGTKARAAQTTRTMLRGDTWYLLNGEPYIIPLEYGHSQQAPQGMLRLTIAELADITAQVAPQVRARQNRNLKSFNLGPFGRRI